MKALHLDRLDPLVELIDRYMQVPHGHKKSPPGYSMRRKLHAIAREIEYALAHDALIADLSQATLDRLFAAWRSQRRKATVRRVLTDAFLALWRFAEECGASTGCPPRKPLWWQQEGRIRLSDADGTLWGLCLTRYFPANISIRSVQTKQQYRFALQKLKEFVGHDPTAADLTEDCIHGMMGMLLDRGLAPKTVNEQRGRLRALWEWMARRRLVDDFPTLHKTPEPKRIPRAWTREEISAIVEACDNEPGWVAGVPARLFWRTLIYILWDSGARIGEIMACRWEWLDWQTGRLEVPYSVRKGGTADMSYLLHADTLALLRQIETPAREIIFAWECGPQVIWRRFKRILRRAGLPTDRRSMFHCIRKSVASHVQAAGHDASVMLAHSSPEITRRSYLDPRIVASVAASTVLFRPAMEEKPRAALAPIAAEEWL